MTQITNHMPTEELQRLDAAHHMHPFTTNDDLEKKGARVITRAKGVTLTDSEGNEILDAMAGLWCVNIGYGRDELAEVSSRQMRELPYYNTFFQTTHVPAIALAERLAELTPYDLNHVFFANSGSEANDTNIRIVRTYWQEKGQPEKTVIISRKNAYHGSSVASSALGGMAGMHAQSGMIPDIHHIDQPNWWAEGGDMSPEDFGLERAQQLEKAILELGEHKVAAFIGEPVQGAGGVIIPPSTYWPEIQRICDKYGILLIADEVICGFGRTGNWFGCETFGMEPDFMTMAKALTSGYVPMGAVAVSDKIVDLIIEKGGEFAHGYTYAGHPAGCAAALATMNILREEAIIERVRDDIGPYLQKKWAALADHPLVGEAPMVGLIGAIQLTADKVTRKPFPSDAGVGMICREHSFNNGLIMRAVGDRMVVAPPLTLSHGEADEMIEKAILTLDMTYADLQAKGLM